MHDRHIFSRNVPSRRPCLTAVLRMAGLRPTRQRVALAEILFGGEHRHVSAEQLLAEAQIA
jgi:Fur family iron response transcriptional regulator